VFSVLLFPQAHGWNLLLIRSFERLPRIDTLSGSLAFALACCGVTALARSALDANTQGLFSILLLFPAIILAGIVGGRIAALAVLAFEALLHAWMSLANGTGAEEAGNLLLFVLTGAVVALAAGEMRHNLDRVRELRNQVARLETFGGVGNWEWAKDGSTLWLSSQAWLLLGQPPQDRSLSVGQLHTLLHPDDVGAFRSATRDLLAGHRRDLTVEFRVVMPEGRTQWRLMHGAALAEGESIAGVLADIDAHKRVESTCQATIARQKLFYEELLHRVRNNFQLIASQLRLQSRRLDPGQRQPLDAAVQRIEGMAALHDALYRDDVTGMTPLDEYLSQICDKLARTLIGGQPLTLAVQAERVMVPAERAMLLGLATTELVRNAIAHGFTPDGAGRVDVHFERVREGFRLRVEDNGQGYDDLALMRMEGFGITLVRSCAQQLGGELLTRRHPLTCFELRLPSQFAAPSCSR